MTSSSTDPPNEMIGHLLFINDQAFGRELIGRLQAAGYEDIRYAHASVFAHLDLDGTRATVLAKRAGMSKVAMGKLVADLEEKGYLQRTPDPKDGRAKLVIPTERGLAHIMTGRRIINEIGNEYAEWLGADRLALLVSLLEELSAVPAREAQAARR